jgi:hypothetical protein
MLSVTGVPTCPITLKNAGRSPALVLNVSSAYTRGAACERMAS